MLGWVVWLPLKQAFKLFYYSRLALGRQPSAHLREDHLQLGQVRRVQPLAGGHRHRQQQQELPLVRNRDWASRCEGSPLVVYINLYILFRFYGVIWLEYTIITVHCQVPSLLYCAIVELDHYVVGCLSFLLILERNTLTVLQGFILILGEKGHLRLWEVIKGQK